MSITSFAHCDRLVAHLAELRGIGTRSNVTSRRYWPPLADDEEGRAELARRIRAVLDGDPCLHGTDQGAMLRDYAATLGGTP